jgi:GMP synthase (glutamine-hydrolysing)
MLAERPLLALTHMPTPEVGLVGHAVAGAGIEMRLLPRDPAARFPALDEIAGIVSFGGQMSALTADRDPFLAAELELLRGAIATGVPVLGLCLGAQLLAIAGGGAVYELDRPHIAVEALDALAPAGGDALGAALPPSLPVIEWHCDGILAPPGA